MNGKKSYRNRGIKMKKAENKVNTRDFTLSARVPKWLKEETKRIAKTIGITTSELVFRILFKELKNSKLYEKTTIKNHIKRYKIKLDINKAEGASLKSEIRYWEKRLKDESKC